MHNKPESPFELLRSKPILAILDGDASFGEINNIKISMPYLSGPTIVGILQMFGLSAVVRQPSLQRLRQCTFQQCSR